MDFILLYFFILFFYFMNIQDGIATIIPFITTRKVIVSIQDFCNILGGGLVSLTTMTPDTVSILGPMPTGAVVIVYEYHVNDVITSTSTSMEVTEVVEVVADKKKSKKGKKVAEEPVEEVKGREMTCK